MGDVTDRVKELERDYERLDIERLAAIRVLREAMGKSDVYGIRANAAAAAERIKTLEDKLAEKVDAGNEDYLRYLKRLGTIDEMLKEAFPDSTETIEDRVGAAVADTRALAEVKKILQGFAGEAFAVIPLASRLVAQLQNERENWATATKRGDTYLTERNALQEARESLASQLDRERRLHDECLKDLLKAKKDRDTWQRMSHDNGEALAEAERARDSFKRQHGLAVGDLSAALRARDSLQNKLNGAMDDLTAERRERNKLTEEVERLRRESPAFSHIREAALAGKPFNVAGREYVLASDGVDTADRDLPTWVIERANARQSLWINGVMYSPANNDDLLRLKRVTKKLEDIARIVETQ